jgi:hypothetical protein
MIRKSTAWGSKSGFILICWMELDFIVAREHIHEGQGLMDDTVIDNLVDERGWEVVFGTSMDEIMKVGVDMNNSLFLLMGTGLETHEVYTMG